VRIVRPIGSPAECGGLADKLSWRRPTYSATLGMDPHPTHMPRPGDPGVVGAPLSWEEACTYIKEEQYEVGGLLRTRVSNLPGVQNMCDGLASAGAAGPSLMLCPCVSAEAGPHAGVALGV
jgi:hypothetical protein